MRLFPSGAQGGIVHWLLLFYTISLLISADCARAETWTYTMRPGDNLWNLTERHLTSLKYVTRLQQLNHIQDPYRIPPGTIIRIPLEWTLRQQGGGQITGFQGTATLRRPGSPEAFPVTGKISVAAGDEITTEQDARVTIEFKDRSRLRVESESKMRLKRSEILGQEAAVVTEVELESGRTESIVPPHSEPASRFRILTPSAVSAVRGTVFRVGAEKKDGTTYNEVLTGVLDVSAKRQHVRLRSGYGTVIRPARPPARPVQLLPAPDLSETPDLFERMPLVMPLKPLTGAHSYRVQIALDQAFSDILTDFVTADPPLRGRLLADGNYWLRVRGRDASGLEGREAVMPVRIHARPEPPFIVTPQAGVRVESDYPAFQWTTRPDITHYLIDISRTAGFEEFASYESASREGHFILPEPLAPGIYWWRIAAVSESVGAGPYSDPVSFRVPVPGPALESAQIEDDEIRLAWPAGEAGRSFRFQMARDREFREIISDTVVDEPGISLPHPGGGTYYLRIRSIGYDGEEGRFGPVQIFEVPRRFPYWLMIFLPLLGLL